MDHSVVSNRDKLTNPNKFNGRLDHLVDRNNDLETYSTLLISPLTTELYQTEANLFIMTSPTTTEFGAIQQFSIYGSNW